MTRCPGGSQYVYLKLESDQYTHVEIGFSNFSSFDFEGCLLSAFYRETFDGRAVLYSSSPCDHFSVTGESNATEDFDFEALIGCSQAASSAVYPTLPPTKPPPTLTPTPTTGNIRSPNASDWWVWVILGVGGAIVVAIYIALRRFFPLAQNALFLTTVFSLFNLATDISFVVSTANLWRNSATMPGLLPPDFDIGAVASAAVAFLVFPSILNVTVSILFLLRERHRNAGFREWLTHNRAATSLVVICSLSAVEVFNLLNSRLFYFSGFSCKWPPVNPIFPPSLLLSPVTLTTTQ